MVGIIDYGVGNLYSLACSFRAIGQEVFVSRDPERLTSADHLILPGVGAFEDAANKLRVSELGQFVAEQVASGKPLMGICLGMQLLFEESYEYGHHKGLGLLQGSVVPMAGKLPDGLKVPHMGWNSLQGCKGRLLGNLPQNSYVYFVHSYFAENCQDSLAAFTEYGIPMTAAVERENIFGCQFHPEKSGAVGLAILESFCKL